MKKTLIDYIPKKHHHMIDYISDERGYGEGYWVYLKARYICADMECGTIHEYTIKDIVEKFKTCRPIQEGDDGYIDYIERK